MVKRKVRRNIKKTIFALLIAALAISAGILLSLSVKNLFPLLKFSSEQKDAIIKPVSEFATREDLSKILSDKNIITEYLVESSASSLFIGQVKDGPKVYFAKTRDAKWQVVSLELILNKLTIENKKPVLIDLRFEQPIVKF
ncbi:MAG: hypothetical protein A3C30_00270 [Candidatus Levybacteria bacterium RIFCSPHIGHO2_02_FULL_40_18]|nr:MAG: hypothetical protein A2869_03965 [Candidatus Levybacteria bacterium RIFCSPHIGHO2_01_FULL_40_58]OGH27138.1 MAG: hypothetical protein A3C30_00270 [Candidatus Levybacteria bacterium RIFCSPHIGHO2_02_FULL_40_18]OGH30997.1 MAG: hypothetical protein A3E43_04685 [Candidatus Levybacteria bacterium RIFCSPHIGHO2_12_FULL_40_31]OGH41008.1 MAG: hypothetical protein A2894_01900 [Candidatus Levybacteria bacterium RIFCSPLOWO2_01_FULL_40_64]OGH48916.1 MAG: hypothetical protein A3I54_02655 [Candidatus Lev